MGSPMVFQTAPPQPASNARAAWSPQLLGGPEASQKGLGDSMPAKRVVRSAMVGLQTAGDTRRRTLAFRDRVHHLAAAVHAVAPREVSRIAGLAGGRVYHDDAARQSNVPDLRQEIEQPGLSDGRNH